MLQRRMPGRLMGSVPLWGGGLGAFKFDPALVTFTRGMAKRLSAGPFETAPIVQGKFDGSGVPDTIIFDRGDQISRNFYANIDGYQGCLNLWWMPEKDRDAGQIDPEYIWYDLAGKYHLVYEHDNARFSLRAGEGGDVGYVSHTAVAGTMVHLMFSWDTKNTLDGTNYFRLSINDVHTFVVSTLPTQATPGSSLYVGSEGFFFPANAIIEGETVYRRPLFDGTYGVAANWDDSGPIDEIEAIYAAGAGQDPCLITGSWDIVFCLPTDSTAGALVTGNGEAWSHPHSSGVLKHQWLEDGGYLGRPWAVLFNAITTEINCGSGATLDDLADDAITVETWIRADGYGEGNTGIIIGKGASASTGWRLLTTSTNGINARVECATTDALVNIGLDDFTADGKLHHITMFFDDAGDRKIYIAIDGKWITSYVTQTAGVGAIVSDAAQDLVIGGNGSGGNTFDGLIGWVAISDNDRYSHGTDFIPPRQPPATDGNYVEMWHLDEGSGATANAEVTSPANDGTISNGTWEEQWDIETTPIVPYTLEFDGAATLVNCGSAADIDDLADNAFTVDAWFRKNGSDLEVLVGKGPRASDGWSMYIDTIGRLIFRVECATTDSVAVWSLDNLIDNKWHYAVGYFNDAGGADRKAYCAVDGLWGTTGALAVGAIVTDVTYDLFIGMSNGTSGEFTGAIGYVRVSDNARWTTGATFTPPSRLNPPASDGNTLRQFNFRDGAGTTLTDDTATANGTITFGDGQWRITPDMEIDSPGERIFNWGYVIGNDAVDEGIKETLSGLDAGQNYVVRAIAHVESASRGRPKIIIYDETNGAQITALEGPSFTGAHDGGDNDADLTDTTARFPQMLVGWTVYNITDGSSATVTAISGDMQVITGVLSGGTDDDWDISDEYRIVPPGGPSEYDDYPWIETFTFELPTIVRNGVAADCVSISLKLVNGVNEGVIKWHQVELLENRVDNPSIETGAGNPWIPDGWTNYTYAAGESTQDAGDFHSGAGSINLAAAVSRYMGIITPAITIDKFYSFGIWMMENSGVVYTSDLNGATRISPHNSNGVIGFNATNAYWTGYFGVLRGNTTGTFTPLIRGTNVHDGNFDDLYCFELDDVSLTVTPASEINSTENGGLRVDGYDNAPQPIPAGAITATAGDMRVKVIPRHDIADMDNFGNTTPVILHAHGDATNYIYVELSAANTIRLRFNDGGGEHLGVWAAAGALVADTDYVFRVRWSATEMLLLVDGITQITIAQPVNFATVPTQFYPGSRQVGDYQIDAVFSSP